MAFFEFPHTRTYDGDLAYILHLLKEIFDNFADTRKDVHFKKSVEIDENLTVHGDTQLGDGPEDSTTIVGSLDLDGDLHVKKELYVDGMSHLHYTAVEGDFSATGLTSLNQVALNNLTIHNLIKSDKWQPGEVLVTNENSEANTSGITTQELGTLAGINTDQTIEVRLTLLSSDLEGVENDINDLRNDMRHLPVYTGGESIEVVESTLPGPRPTYIINFAPLTHAEIDTLIAEVFPE